MNWLLKKKQIPEFTYPEAKKKVKTRYINYEIDKVNAAYRQVVEKRFKRAEIGK